MAIEEEFNCMANTSEPVAVLMAAGKSTRMKSDLPKVLHQLCGQPLLAYVLTALEAAGIRRKIVVIGFGGNLVRAQFQHYPGVEFVEQTEQRGTGHAVLVCEPAIGQQTGPVLVLAGDMPFARPGMITELLGQREKHNAACILATAVVSDPFGMGRILRDEAGEFVRIVEQKDASP